MQEHSKKQQMEKRFTLQTNSTSSLSMSLTTMIFIFAKKCRARSVTASLQHVQRFIRKKRKETAAVFTSNIKMQSLSEPNIKMQSLSEPNIKMQSLSEPNIKMQSLSEPISLDQATHHQGCG
jgi:hypothetical protein